MLLNRAVLGRGNRLLSLNEKKNHQIFCKNFIRSNYSSMNYIRNGPDYIFSAAAYYYAKKFNRGSNMANLTALKDIEQLSSSVCRILGQNPGPFTLQGTNTYLVGSGNSKILIDTGEPNITEYTEKLSEALGSNGKIEAIIITHWHIDHVGGIPNVIKLLGGAEIPVYKFKRSDNVAETDYNYTYVKHDHEIKVEGASLQLIYSPGHTTDHMAILHKEENALFSGDCILGEGSAIFEDLHTYMNSLNKFLEIKPNKIYPGHGPVVDNPQNKIEEYIKHRMQRENDILSVLSETSVMSSMDITNAVYKDIPFAVKLGALGNVKHHLTKLIKDERVIKNGSDNYLLKSNN
jgi:ribonuclease/clavin/mitogillin